jgi:hypothetical protein
MKAENEAHFRAQGEGGEDAVLTGRQKVILIVFALAFLVMMYGVIPWDDLGVPLPTLWWWFSEMTASFLLFTIIIGLIARMKEGELTSTFVDGARDLLGVALIIGIARGITVIMNNGEITDTVLHWAEVALGDVGKAAFSIVMYVAVPAAVVPDPVVVRPGDRLHADHGAPRRFRGGARAAGGHGVPERERADEPVHPDVGRGDGRPGDRPGPVRALPAVGVAAARHARGRRGDRARRRRGILLSEANVESRADRIRDREMETRPA